MKTSATDPPAAAPLLIVFADETGRLGCWLLLDRDESASGEVAAGLPAGQARTVLVVPGEQVTLHWLELAEGLTGPQAAAAARLMLADASADPLADMHVAVGRAERGRTPVALAPAASMSAWLAAAASVALDPDLVTPSPMLLAPPDAGFVRRQVTTVWDYRGPAAAFAIEPELAGPLVGEASVDTIDEARFAAGLPALLAAPALDLRQGPFARRRQWRMEGRRLRRVAALAVALAGLSLAVQVATILSFTFAADRLEAEAAALAGAPGAGADARPGFGAAAAILFEAVRATPNVELSRIDYRADGSLDATVMLDSPATFAALQARIEAGGLSVEPGERRSAGGRPTADLTVRPA